MASTPFRFFTAEEIFEDALPHIPQRQRPEVTPIEPTKAHPGATILRGEPISAQPSATRCCATRSGLRPSRHSVELARARDASKAPKLITLKTCLMPTEARELIAEYLSAMGMSKAQADVLHRKLSTSAIRRRSRKG